MQHNQAHTEHQLPDTHSTLFPTLFTEPCRTAGNDVAAAATVSLFYYTTNAPQLQDHLQT